MSTIIAYAIALFVNLGVVSATDVNSASNYIVTQRDGKTIVVDAHSGAEVIIYP